MAEIEPMWDAFISYRRRDATALARYVRRRLLRFRLPAEVLARLDERGRALHRRRPRIWLDTAYERPSDDFLTRKVFPALDGASRLILLSTPAAFEPLTGPDGLEPNWLVREIERFVDRDRDAAADRPIDVVLGPGAPEDRFPGPLGAKPRIDWIDLRAFHRHRWNPLDESRDAAVAKLVAGLYAVDDADLPALQRAERRQRTFWLFIGLVVAVLVAVAMVMLAGYAQYQHQAASEQRDLAVARLLGSEGYRMAAGSPARAKGYFLASIGLVETPGAISGLMTLLSQDPHATLRFLPLAADASALHVRPDGRVAIGQADGTLLRWSIAGSASAAGEAQLAGGASTTRLGGLGAAIIALAQPGDGVLAIDDQGRLIEWASPGDTPQVLVQLAPAAEISRRLYDHSPEAVIAEDGSAAALPTERGIVYWRRGQGATRLLQPDMAAGGPVALSADGRRLAYATGGDLSHQVPMRIMDPGAPDVPVVDLPPQPRGIGAVLSADFARDGKTLAAGTANGFIQLWQVDGPPRAFHLLEHRVVPRPGAHEVVEHVFTGADARHLVSRFGGGWQIWDIPSGTPLGPPVVTPSTVAAFADARQSLLTVRDQTVLVQDFHVDRLRDLACLSGARELSDEEWSDVAGDAPKPSVCGR